MITPRPYQYDAVESVWNYFRHKSGNPLIAMPTGTGKAIVIGMILKRAFWEYSRQRVLIMTHVKELVDQNYTKLLQLWPQAPAGINSAGLGRRDLNDPILFAGVKSIANQLHMLGKVDLAIVDEAHLISPDEKSTYQQVFKELKARNPNFKIIGLSATCFRLGQGMLTDGDKALFTDICYDVTTLEQFNMFLSEGYLSRLVPKKTKIELNVDDVHISAGEFKSNELQIAVDKDEITEAAIKEAIELGSDRQRWLVFASGLHHMQRISEMLDMYGISNVVIHSKMKDKERDENIAKLKRGEVRAGINFGVLTTGFDDPLIDMIVMLRPTASPVLWVQMLGRGTRPVYADGFDLSNTEGRLAAISHGPKQNCLVLDFAGNTKRLGPINDPRIPKQKGKGGGTAPVKLCHVCDTYNHASVRFCTNCGAEFTFEIKITSQSDTKELISDSFPIVETFEVNHVSYSEHIKVGKPPMIRCTYYTNQHSYSDYICLEHEGYARKRAVEWWNTRVGGEVPSKVKEAIQIIDMAKTPTHIKVWVNKKMPEIMQYCFDGTAFGTQTRLRDNPTGEVREHSHHTNIDGPLHAAMKKYNHAEEDDIPF